MDTPDTASIAEAAGFRFLDLPSELRNRIYDRCVEKTYEEYLRGYGYCYDYVWSLRRQNRKFKNLTQVCRQIRAEYLPLYNKRTTFAVELKDLHPYIRTFVKLPGVASTELAGNIIVAGKRSDATCLNLNGLMEMANKARSLKIKWHDCAGYGFQDLTPIIDAFLHLDDNPVLREYVSRSLTKIQVRVNFRPYLEIWLSIKKESWEDWMGIGHHVNTLDYDEKIVEWAAAAHLPYPLMEDSECIHFVPV